MMPETDAAPPAQDSAPSPDPSGSSAAKEPVAPSGPKATPSKSKASASRARAAKAAPPKRRPAKKAPPKRVPAKRTAAKRKIPRKRSTRSRSSARSRRATSFKVNDKVVHPHHGAAVITRKIEQEVAGVRRSYFELQIATEQLTVFVPVDTIDDNIRPVISKTAAGKVLRIFKEEPQASGKNWSRWYKVLNEKMTSGDINQVAEVVRDLTHAQNTKGISPALKRMLSRAKVTLRSELAFAFSISPEEAEERIERALPVPETSEA